MDIETLREFAAAAENESFLEAGEQLGISPSAVSAHISLLEKELNVSLFNRRRRKTVLTEQGRIFAADARSIAKEWELIRTRIAALDKAAGGRLSIAITGFAMPPRIGPFLDIFNLRHPEVKLSLLDDSVYGIGNSLKKDIDIYFAYSSDDVDMPDSDIVVEQVFTTTLCALIPSSHRLANKPQINLRELEGEQFILPPDTAEKENSMRRIQQRILNNSGISYTVYDEAASASRYHLLVPVGKGIAFFPWVARALTPPYSQLVTIADESCRITMYMYYSRENTNPLMKTFIDEFQEYLSRKDAP